MIESEFKKIDFGRVAAEKERAHSERLLTEGFLDAFGYIDKVTSGSKFLVYGQKGSGKSAIGSKVELMAPEKGFVVKQVVLDQFDYNEFDGVLPGKNAPEVKNVNTWEFLLATEILEEYIKKDACSSISGKHNLNKTRELMKEIGISADDELSKLVTKTSKKSLEFGGPLFKIAFESSKEYNTSMRKITAYFEEIMYDMRPQKEHIIVIDGLDSALTKRQNQYEVLSGLIHAADSMNNKFHVNKVDTTIVVLCRTDVLDKLSDPNKNKIIRDSGLVLDWYQDVNDPRETNLYKLVNLRAKVSLGRDVDVFTEFFPEHMSVGSKKKETAKFLLEYTRHTPRDIIQLVNEIQNSSTGKKVTSNEIKNAIRKYSDNYFMNEIKDGLVGFLTDEDVENIFSIISSIDKDKMTLQEMKFRAEKLKIKIDFEKVLSALYDAGAIANIADNKYFSYKFRNRHSRFDVFSEIFVHRALHSALGLGARAETVNGPHF